MKVMSWKIDRLKVETLPDLHGKELQDILLAILLPHDSLIILGQIVACGPFLPPCQLYLFGVKTIAPIELIVAESILLSFSIALYQDALWPNG